MKPTYFLNPLVRLDPMPYLGDPLHQGDIVILGDSGKYYTVSEVQVDVRNANAGIRKPPVWQPVSIYYHLREGS